MKKIFTISIVFVFFIISKVNAKTLPSDSVKTLTVLSGINQEPFLYRENIAGAECISYKIIAGKAKYEVGETAKITLRLDWFNTTQSSYNLDECQKFSINVAMPKNFKQSGGTYKDYRNINLNNTNKFAEFTIEGTFSSPDSLGCFILMKGPQNSSSTTIFIKKAELCLESYLVQNPITNQTTEKTDILTPTNVQTQSSSTPCIVSQIVDRDVVCVGESVTLTAPNCTGSTKWIKRQYDLNNNWISTDNNFTSTTNTKVDQYTVVGIYTYDAPECIGGTGTCPSGGYLTVTVKNGSPALVTTPSLLGSLCSSTDLLTASNCTGVLHWYSIYGLGSDPNNLNLYQGPIGVSSSSGINGYNFVKCEVGCSLSDESNGVYNNYINIPTISSNSLSYCPGGSPVTLTATGCAIWQTVSWSNGMTGNVINVTPTNTFQYIAKCNQFDSNGLLVCPNNSGNSNIIEIVLNSSSLQTPTITPVTKNVCSSESSLTNISASGCTNGYLWSTGATTSSITVQPTQTTTYTVRCGSSVGCLGPEKTSTINILQSPAPTTPWITSNMPISGTYLYNCSGQTVTLTANNCNGIVEWRKRPHNTTSVQFFIGNDPTITLPDDEHVVYQLGCKTECRATITYAAEIIYFPPVKNITVGSNSPILVGQSINLTSSASNFGYSAQGVYSWTGPNSYVNSTQNPSINGATLTQQGTYIVTIRNSISNCSATASTFVSITDCAPGSQLITANPSLNPNITYTDKNNIVVNNYLKPTKIIPTTNFEISQTITYLDGFGRVIQDISTASTPLGRDFIQPYEYDLFGRQTKSYLPYASPSSVNGSFKSAAISEQAAFYNTLKGDNMAYAQTLMEFAPTDIVKQEGFVGSSWQPNSTTPASAKTIKNDYKHSTETTIRKFVYNYSTLQWVISTYGANELMLNETKDIDNNIVEEFYDFAGNLVCKKVWDAVKTVSRVHVTYYAYDGFDRLRFVFPPAASKNITATSPANNSNITPLTNASFNSLISYYEYDSRGRIIAKKAQGVTNFEYFVYDELNQETLYQSAQNKISNTWQYTKYDELGRISSQGNIVLNTAQAAMQTNVNNTNTSAILYGNSAYPTTGITENKRYYYDSYGGFAQPVSGTISTTPGAYNLPASSAVNGKLVGVKERIIRPTDATVLTRTELITAYYYDDLGNLIQTASQNHNGSNSYKSIFYDFADRVTQTRGALTYTGGSIYTTNDFVYDRGSRIFGIFQNSNPNNAYMAGEARELIAKFSYNEIGELTGKVQGCNYQNILYKYDIQGKLTEINEINTANLNTQKKFFGEKLTYNLNGTINKIEWGTIPKPNATAAELPPTRSYTNTYDFMYRLTGAAYLGKAGEDFSSTIQYDGNLVGNGNITTITRKRGTLTEDNLTLAYVTNTNLLNTTTDASTSNTATGYFKNGTNTGADYTYDAAGNMLSDANRGILSIAYNYMNLPEKITFTGSKFIRYIYTASGEKIRKEDHTNVKIDYSGGLVFKDNILEFIPTPEGRMIKDGANWRTEYQISDHMGNLRSTYYYNKTAPVGTDPLTLLQENHYDPFGVNLVDIEKPYVNTDRYQYNGMAEKGTIPDGSSDYETDFRLYDPQIGRFKAVDPLGELTLALNPYSFAFNNPMSFNDPSGLLPSGPKPKYYRSNATRNWVGYNSGTNQFKGNGPLMSYSNVEKVTSVAAVSAIAGNLIVNNGNTKKLNATTNSSNGAGPTPPSSGGSSLSPSDKEMSFKNFIDAYRSVVHIMDKQAEKSTFGKVNKTVYNISSTFNYTINALNFAAVKTDGSDLDGNETGTFGSAMFLLGAIPGGGGGRAAAKGSTHTIYRVVSKSEASDVLANGFRQAPISSKISSYEGKLFWSNLDDANWFKSWKGADDVIIKVKVNNSFIYENGYDVGRLFYYVSPERMGTFNSVIKVIK
jgi:RHS repeat-associated protein